MTQLKRGPGRPSAGPRHVIVTRVDIKVADLVRAEAEARDMSYSGYVAAILAQAHGIPTELPARLQPVAEQPPLDTLTTLGDRR